MISSFLVVVAVVVGSQNVGAQCTGGFVAFGGACYGYVNNPQSWTDAQSTCSALGGFLAEVYSVEENDFLKNLSRAHGSHEVWLGADDLLQEGKWYWAKSGGALNEYNDWAPGQPDGLDTDGENCLELNTNKFSGHWNDDWCDHNKRFICQKYISNDIIG